MKPITKAICSAYCEQRNWKKEIYQFLLHYRSTPHCTTGYSPGELLFSRKIRNKLPHHEENPASSNIQQTVAEIDKAAKEKMKDYADKHRNATEGNIEIGDTILVMQMKVNK